MEASKTGPRAQVVELPQGRERLRRLNLWVPEKVHGALLREAGARGVTLSACAGLRLAGEVEVVKSGASTESLERELEGLNARIRELENERRANANNKTLLEAARKAIAALKSRNDALLEQKATLDNCNRSWQEKSAQDEETIRAFDEMMKRLSILKLAELDDEVERALRYVMLGESMS